MRAAAGRWSCPWRGSARGASRRARPDQEAPDPATGAWAELALPTFVPPCPWLKKPCCAVAVADGAAVLAVAWRAVTAAIADGRGGWVAIAPPMTPKPSTAATVIPFLNLLRR